MYSHKIVILVLLFFGGVIFANTAPTHATPLLDSTSSTSLTGTNENLTVYNQSTVDLEEDPVKNIINWYLDDNSFTVLNMPFEGGSQTGDVDGITDAAKDYSGYGNNATTYNATWDSTNGYDNFGAYYFNGTNDYPTIPSLEAKCRELFPNHSFLVKDDIIRLEPNA